MVGLVEHNQIPRCGTFQKGLGAVAAAHQVARRDDHRFLVPVVVVHFAFVVLAQRGGGVPDQLVAVIDRPVEIEFLAQFDLPLSEHRFGRQDQDACGTAGEPGLAQQHAGLNGFSETDLVGDQQPRRPVAVKPFESPHLMGPWNDRRGCLSHTLTAFGHRRSVPDERPDAASQIPRFGRWRFLGRCGPGRRLGGGRLDGFRFGFLLEAGRHVGLRQEAHEALASGVGDVQHDDALRLVGPYTGEVGILFIYPGRIRSPTRIDVDAFPVVLPPRGRLVEAAVPRKAVASTILDSTRLFVKDAVCRDGPPVAIAGNRHPDVQVAACDHPRQQFESVGGCLIRGCQGQGGHVTLDELAELFAFFDGRNFRRFQRAADNQAHPAVVAHESFNPACRQPQRVGVEIAGQPVVALGVFEGGYVEESYEIAVVRGVFELPGAVAEHAQLSLSRHSFSCAGSSILSR